MDSSGFLTLIAVILTAFSLLSLGRKISYWHKFGWLHRFFFVVGACVVLCCLFYETLKAHGLLLPYDFIAGFNEDQLLLVTSIVMLIEFLRTIKYGDTKEHCLNALCENIDGLLSNGSLGDLVYVLSTNKKFFMRESIKSKAITEKTLKKLILSNRFTSYLSDMDYQLYLFLLKLYPKNEVFKRKFTEFIALQLSDQKSSLIWEVELLRQSYSPRIPNVDTPLLKTLYHEVNPERKYTFYEQIGIQFDRLMREKKVIRDLNVSPSNVQTDLVINNCMANLYIFLFFNLLKCDIRQKQDLRSSPSEICVSWIFTKKFFRKLVDNRIDSIDSENEFKTIFDFLIYDSFHSYNSLFELEQTLSINHNDLDDLVETIGFAYFYVHTSNKFDIELTGSLLKFCINIFKKLKIISLDLPDLSRKLAILCTHEYKGAPRSVNINTEDIERLKLPEAEEFIKIAMLDN